MYLFINKAMKNHWMIFAFQFQAAGPYLDQILELVEDEEARYLMAFQNGYLMGI